MMALALMDSAGPQPDIAAPLAMRLIDDAMV
jgi:hypothetical protein